MFMKNPRYRCLLAALVSALALAAVAASASALEFRSGKYPVTFTGTGNATTFQEHGGGLYTCNSSSISGEITGPNEVSKVVMKFNGVVGCNGFCRQSPKTGVWETKELKGRLGWIKKSTSEVGLLLEPVTQPIANCERAVSQKWKLQGSLIGQITPVRETWGTVNPFLVSLEELEGRDGIRQFEGEEAVHALQMGIVGGESVEAGIKVHGGLSLKTSQAIEIAG
jgi:hypothetical protein